VPTTSRSLSATPRYVTSQNTAQTTMKLVLIKYELMPFRRYSDVTINRGYLIVTVSRKDRMLVFCMESVSLPLHYKNEHRTVITTMLHGCSVKLLHADERVERRLGLAHAVNNHHNVGNNREEDYSQDRPIPRRNAKPSSFARRSKRVPFLT